jgi:hypothetical protein
VRHHHPNPAIEELINQQTKNPIYVHYLRVECPGFHNRGHRKAISRAWQEYLMDSITSINPWDTPWMNFSIITSLKNVLNVSKKPEWAQGVSDVGFYDGQDSIKFPIFNGSKEIKKSVSNTLVVDL